MYQLSKFCLINNIRVRGVFLTKKNNNKKQTLIFLRSPKHFNIGKRKVISFNNKQNYIYSLYFHTQKNNIYSNYFIFNLIYKLYYFNILYRINSIKLSVITKIKW